MRPLVVALLLVGLDRLAARFLHGIVGSALLATGPEALLTALVGLVCLAVHLLVLASVPVLVGVWAQRWASAQSMAPKIPR